MSIDPNLFMWLRPEERSLEKTKQVLYTACMVDVKTEITPLNPEVGPAQTGTSRPESFSLAHLSDLHLTSLKTVNYSQLFNKRILGYLSWLHKRRIVHRFEIIESLLEDLRVTCPDHIAVTGDLTHLGLPMEYDEVQQWLPSLGNPKEVTLIPGNHEAYTGKNWFRFCDQWAPYLESDTGQNSPKTAGFFPSLRIRGQVALIGLCTARPSAPFLAVGSLGQQQLVELETLLEKTANKGLLRIILIHHPPVPDLVTWRKCLTDNTAFSAILAKHGAELILHGHAHIPSYTEIKTPAGFIPVIGAPSASELNPRSGSYAKYNIYRIEKRGINWELTMEVRSYSVARKQFVFEKECVMTTPSTACINSTVGLVPPAAC